MGDVILTYELKETKHASFAAAVVDIVERLKAAEGVPLMILDTIWIEERPGHPLFFHDIIDRAHKEGVLTPDGKLAVDQLPKEP